jgi:threonine synthase
MKAIFECINCGKKFSQDEVKYLCPDCGRNLFVKYPLEGVLFAKYEYDEIKFRNKSEGYSVEHFLPFDRKYFPEFKFGNTPFFRADRLGKKFGIENLFIKNDSLNPSGSLKDRASYMVVAQANVLNENTIVTASTGNAASSLADVCASENKKAIIYVPERAPLAKRIQMKLFGADVIEVKGTYDDAFRLSILHTNEKGGLNRNTAYNPYTIEGKKTVGLEIYRDMYFNVPDVILVPVGDGVIISGVFKAFYDLYESGLTDRIPRLICIQSEKSDAIHRFFTSGSYHNIENPQTVADSISVSSPSNAYMAVRALKTTGGSSVTVSDEEIMNAQKTLAENSGIYAEPSSSSIIAALPKLFERNLIDKKEKIVLLITGNGLKDTEATKNFLIQN